MHLQCKTLSANSELQYSPVIVLPNQGQLQTMRGRCISNTNLPSAQLEVENKNTTEGDREGSALYIDSQHMPSELGEIQSNVCSVRRLRSLELKSG